MASAASAAAAMTAMTQPRTVLNLVHSACSSMDPDTLAELAAEVLGPERVRSAERLDDALEIDVGLADDAAGADGLGRPGVLVTGAVITAGDARLLLTAQTRGAPDQA